MFFTPSLCILITVDNFFHPSGSKTGTIMMAIQFVTRKSSSPAELPVKSGFPEPQHKFHSSQFFLTDLKAKAFAANSTQLKKEIPNPNFSISD